jgi:hypothetical protein
MEREGKRKPSRALPRPPGDEYGPLCVPPPGFPRHHRVLHVKQEVRSSEKSVLETVLQSDVEREALLEEEREIVARQGAMREDADVAQVQADSHRLQVMMMIIIIICNPINSIIIYRGRGRRSSRRRGRSSRDRGP